ncbi:YceI family protein [Dyadobacter aurulentus]|uniref:YceI family protein n=1 Tax=Dyadobacter sp. UC 10 TaxID=2605428 RepID=UPI0011F358E8|nr:YceI family protein [Dyadobacter sp. UC 10]KAA0993666.1 YceI family protein [Dyadobacter sp. UC 10]
MKIVNSIFGRMQFLAFVAVSGFFFSCTDHEVGNSQFGLDDTSIAQWKGHLKTGFFNEGSIAVKSESFVIEDSKVKSGTFTIPVSSIVNFNQPTKELKQALVHHLQSPDFFNMVLHPNVKFEITSVTPSSESGDGIISGANHKVTGNLTMLGNTRPLSFLARISINGDNFSMEALAPFDRTLWGINYATEPGLPDEASIKPVVDVHLKLSGKRK